MCSCVCMCVWDHKCVSHRDDRWQNQWRKKQASLNCLTASVWEDGTEIINEEVRETFSLAACLHHVLHKKVSKLKLLYTEDAQITKNSSQLLTLLTHYYKNLWSSTNHLWSSHHTSQTGREQSGVFTTEQLKPAVDLWVYTPHIQLWRDAGAHLEQTLPSVHTDVRGWETLTGTVVDDKHHQSEVKSQRVGGFMVIWRELLLHGFINTDETKQTVNNYIEKKQLPVSMCTCSVLIKRVFLFPPESGRVSTLL